MKIEFEFDRKKFLNTIGLLSLVFIAGMGKRPNYAISKEQAFQIMESELKKHGDKTSDNYKIEIEIDSKTHEWLFFLTPIKGVLKPGDEFSVFVNYDTGHTNYWGGL